MISSWQALQIINEENLSLAALLKETKPPENIGGAPCRDDALVVVCHGFTGSKEGRGQAVAMGDELALLGFSTLLFDFAGCGESEGDGRDRTLSSQIEDLSAVVKWCRREGFGRIILAGRSFGASTILGYAATDKAIAAVCTWAAVARPDRLFLPIIKGQIEGPADELIIMEGQGQRLELKRAFFQDLVKHNLLDCAAAIAPRSLLVVHGSADESVSPKDAELIYNAAAEPKKIVIIEGADHRFSNHTDQVWEVFFDWLKTI
jgi:uncharacterized protein